LAGRSIEQSHLTRQRRQVAHRRSKGGGRTVADSTTGGLTVPESISSDIVTVLRYLADKLEASPYGCKSGGYGTADNDNVLLDVELGDVRFLALRRSHPSPMSLLSPREQEIARMVAQGYANKTIASVLEISTWTVASHLRRIFVKLQVSSRAAMATSLVETEFKALPASHNGNLDPDGIGSPSAHAAS
jgi:DNA-binding CsgD family transcriptional regulator